MPNEQHNALVGVQMSYAFPCGTKVCHSMTPKNR